MDTQLIPVLIEIDTQEEPAQAALTLLEGLVQITAMLLDTVPSEMLLPTADALDRLAELYSTEYGDNPNSIIAASFATGLSYSCHRRHEGSQKQ